MECSMMKVVVCFLCVVIKFWFVNASDFPSFLHTNASLAVIVDNEYMRKRNEEILSQVQKTLDDIIRENLSNGGLNVQYFAWSTVRLKKDFIAAIIVADCTNTWRIFENADQNSILLLAITDAGCPRLPTKKAVMIPIIERGEEIPQLFLDIKVQKVLAWKSAVFIFDSSIGERLTQIISSLVREGPKNLYDPISIYMYKVDQQLKYQKKIDVVKDSLERFSKMKKTKFIVFMKSIKEIAEVAAHFNMFNVYNEWLFLLPVVKNEEDILYITQGLNEGINIAFALNRTIEDCQETLFCSVTECIFAFVTALSKIIAEEYLLYGQISDEEWEAIRLTKKERQEQMLMHIKNYLIDKSKCSGCSRWEFKSIESWGKSERYDKTTDGTDFRGNSKFLDVGYWSPMLGFFAKDVLFPHASHKFRNITLKVLTYDNPPWQILTYGEKGNIIGASGITMEILKEISHKLNFTYKLQDAFILEDGFSGINENSTMKLRNSLSTFLPPKLNEIFTKKIMDGAYFLVAVGATIYETDRMPYNFSLPISTQTYTFISRKPDEVSRIYLFTAPFTLMSWICLVAAILVTAPVLYLINRLGPVNSLKSSGLLKIKNCFWYIYGALLQQGGLYLPKADSGRVIIGVWWIVVIVIVTTYCGNLVAFLTFPKFQPGIEHLSQIFQHKEMQVFGLRNGTFFEKYSKQSSRNDFKQYMEKAYLYNDKASEDIGAVRKGVRINIDWKIHLQLAIQREYERTKACDYILAKETFVDEQIGLILPGGSPYLELVNSEIKRLHQMGFMERWHQIYMPANDKCTSSHVNRQITNHMVNLDDMQGCFLVLLFGFIVSTMFIAGEFWIYRLYLANKKKFDLFAN